MHSKSQASRRDQRYTAVMRQQHNGGGEASVSQESEGVCVGAIWPAYSALLDVWVDVRVCVLWAACG